MKGTTLIVSSMSYDKDKYSSEEYIKGENYQLYKNFNKKFLADKVFDEDDEYVVVIDGVILNNKELYSKYGVSDNFSLIKKMFEDHGSLFVDQLRGNFYGIIFDKKRREWFVFTNHLNSKPLYYYINDNKDTFVVSSDLFDLIKALKNLNIKVNLDEISAYCMLTFGYMVEDMTLIKEIRKIEPATVMKYFNSELTKKQYFFIDNENYLKDSEDKIIDNMYELFSNSVDLSFKKDEEFGYKHITYLSGGLDSRMIGIAAKKLGYNDITSITFSENYSRDEKIARKIADDFQYESIFKSLNNGNYLKNIDEAVDGNFGQNIYSGAVHLVSTNDVINFDKYGFIFNGNIADVMHGDYIEAPQHTKPSIGNWMYSKRLMDKVSFLQPIVEKKYSNEEKFAIYNRGINGMFNGSVSALGISETCEPFLNQDAIAYCSRMSPELKYKERAFIKMIQKHYPEATNYKWQKWNLKPTPFNQKFMGTFPGKVFRVLDGQIQRFTSQSNNMNPFDKWYSENESLRKFVYDYIKDNFYVLDKYSDLKKDCELLVKEGNLVEKTQVMTLLNFIGRVNEIYG